MPVLGISAPSRARAVDRPVRLRSPGGTPVVLGHMGAPTLAPANTAESFLAATQAGADGIELDLIAVSDGDVIVAHDLGDVHNRPDALNLDELSDLLAEPPLASTPVLLDVKTRGTERPLALALVAARLTPRAIISTTDPAVLRGLRRAVPGATRSQTFPRSRREPQRHAVSRFLAKVRQPFTRAILPAIAWRAIQRHGLAAVTVRYDLVTPALRRVTERRGVELIVWTVDDPKVASDLLAMGVDAIITNDPHAVLDARARFIAGQSPARRHQ